MSTDLADLKAMVQYDDNAQAMQVTDTTTMPGDWTHFDYPHFWDNYYPYYHHEHYPIVQYYPEVRYEKSKVEQAFKIVENLIKEKTIANITLKVFIDLVHKIAEGL